MLLYGHDAMALIRCEQDNTSAPIFCITKGVCSVDVNELENVSLDDDDAATRNCDEGLDNAAAELDNDHDEGCERDEKAFQEQSSPPSHSSQDDHSDASKEDPTSLEEDTQAVNSRRRRSSSVILLENLLQDIYHLLNSQNSRKQSTDSTSDCMENYEQERGRRFKYMDSSMLQSKENSELEEIRTNYWNEVVHLNKLLLQFLKKRDRLKTKREQYYDLVTAALQAISPKRSIDTKMRFSMEPYPGDSGFNQWRDAMKMVARLPGGIPVEFRKRLWLNLADRHVQYRKINWPATNRFCFNDKTNPDDEALGVQIVKDLHRTGCSLFSGEESEHNQALLKQVLLAYARWNKTVGYCQGFNMLAAIILEVMERQVEDSLKVMIFLIEGVLPESYFANNLRGLSVDMAVFRDLLRMRLPGLSRHLDRLQTEAQDGATGTSYEPPLINVFTMQWFLTLFSNCLPKSSVLRVWDLIFLEGNEVLLRTALAIWDGLADRILTVESADEFYSIMGVLTREMMEFGLMDTNELIKTICTMAPFPFPQLADLREKYTFNIRPLTSSFTIVKRGFQIFQSDDEEDNDHDDQLVMATWCLSNAFSLSKHKGEGGSTTPSPSTSTMTFANVSPGALSSGGEANYLSPSCNNVDPQRMTLDISLLKKQYAKLRERQKQAHIILTGGFHQSPSSTVSKSTVAVNHLLIGKKPLVRKNRRQSATAPSTPIQPPRDSSLMRLQKSAGKGPQASRESGETLSWADVKNEKKKQRLSSKLSDPSLPSLSEVTKAESIPVPSPVHEKEDAANDSDTSSSSTELCDDISADDLSDYLSSPEPQRKILATKAAATSNLAESISAKTQDRPNIVPEPFVQTSASANAIKDLPSPEKSSSSSSSSSDSEPRYDFELRSESKEKVSAVKGLSSPIKSSSSDSEPRYDDEVQMAKDKAKLLSPHLSAESSSNSESEPSFKDKVKCDVDQSKDLTDVGVTRTDLLLSDGLKLGQHDDDEETKDDLVQTGNDISNKDLLSCPIKLSDSSEPKYDEEVRDYYANKHGSFSNIPNLLSPIKDISIGGDSEPKEQDELALHDSPLNSLSPLDSPIRYSWEDDKEYESMKSRIMSDIMGDLSLGSLESTLRNLSTASKPEPSSCQESSSAFASDSTSGFKATSDLKEFSLEALTEPKTTTGCLEATISALSSPLDISMREEPNKFGSDFLSQVKSESLLHEGCKDLSSELKYSPLETKSFKDPIETKEEDSKYFTEKYSFLESEFSLETKNILDTKEDAKRSVMEEKVLSDEKSSYKFDFSFETKMDSIQHEKSLSSPTKEKTTGNFSLETKPLDTRDDKEVMHFATKMCSSQEERKHLQIQKSLSDDTVMVKKSNNRSDAEKTANGIGLHDGYKSLTDEIHSNHRKNSKAQITGTEQPSESVHPSWKSSSGSLFNPFPTTRQKLRTSSISEVGVRLGLYNPSDNKRTSEKEPLTRSRSTSASSQHR